MSKAELTSLMFGGAFALSLIIEPVLLPILRKLKAGQTVRTTGPETHLVKNGTPTMGGIMIILSFLVPSIFVTIKNPEFIPLIASVVLLGIVGFVDDYLKVKRKKSEGLKAWQKMSMQIVFTAGIVAYMYFLTDIDLSVAIPFYPGHEINMGIFVMIFDFFVIIATDTGANFTDGLDGLVTKVTLVILAFLFVAALKQDSAFIYPIGAFAGSLLAFLCFNSFPAKVFMGDTGALAIGGFVAVCAIELKLPLFLLVIAFVYVAEVGSVILQVSYFKITHGKRIFKMTPIHHHFEKSGWKETKVVTVFTVVTILLCLVAYLGL